MLIIDESYQAKIVSGPDRLALANSLFDQDDVTDDARSICLTAENEIGKQGRQIHIVIDKLYRESGGQVKKWCFEGHIPNGKAVERTGLDITSQVKGYYDLNHRTGWIRFMRV